MIIPTACEDSHREGRQFPIPRAVASEPQERHQHFPRLFVDPDYLGMGRTALRTEPDRPGRRPFRTEGPRDPFSTRHRRQAGQMRHFTCGQERYIEHFEGVLYRLDIDPEVAGAVPRGDRDGDSFAVGVRDRRYVSTAGIGKVAEPRLAVPIGLDRQIGGVARRPAVGPPEPANGLLGGDPFPDPMRPLAIRTIQGETGLSLLGGKLGLLRRATRRPAVPYRPEGAQPHDAGLVVRELRTGGQLLAHENQVRSSEDVAISARPVEAPVGPIPDRHPQATVGADQVDVDEDPMPLNLANLDPASDRHVPAEGNIAEERNRPMPSGKITSP